MVAINQRYQQEREEWIAHLTEIAYRAVIQRGYQGSFQELELSLLREVRQVVDNRWPADGSSTFERALPVEVA